MKTNLALYQETHQLLHKKKNHDVLDVLRRRANSIRRWGYGCFGLSFLCCCCTSDMGKTTLMVGEGGDHWVRALRVYECVHKEVVTDIFLTVMRFLSTLEQRYRHIQKSLESSKKSLASNNTRDTWLDEMQGHIRHLQWKADLMGDRWFDTLINDMYGHIAYGKEIRYIHVSDEEKLYLLMALPLFLPILHSKLPYTSRGLDDLVFGKIQKLLSVHKSLTST